jgi:hypothetical protein
MPEAVQNKRERRPHQVEFLPAGGEHHRHALRHTRANQIPGRGSTTIMQQALWQLGRLEGIQMVTRVVFQLRQHVTLLLSISKMSLIGISAPAAPMALRSA